MKRVLSLVAATVFVASGAGLAVAGSCGSSKAHSHDASDEHHAEQAAYTAEKADIVDLAVAAGSFKTLTAALSAADLVDVLRGDGPFTVFAPTDEAFAKLPEGTVESLLQPENRDKLVAILKYHVVAGTLDSGAVSGRSSVKTVTGEAIQIGQTEDGLRVGGSKILKADLLASNGVVHVIDTVLLPS